MRATNGAAPIAETPATTLTSHLEDRGVAPVRRLGRGMLHLHCHDKLPAPANAADEDTIVVADGLSCREQILDGSGRDSLHLVAVIERCL